MPLEDVPELTFDEACEQAHSKCIESYDGGYPGSLQPGLARLAIGIERARQLIETPPLIVELLMKRVGAKR